MSRRPPDEHDDPDEQRLDDIAWAQWLGGYLVGLLTREVDRGTSRVPVHLVRVDGGVALLELRTLAGRRVRVQLLVTPVPREETP
jgi:hypothetical protein